MEKEATAISSEKKVLAEATDNTRYNTYIIFLAALELAAAEKNDEAKEAIMHINKPMATLIQTLLDGDIEPLLSSPQCSSYADAWEALAETVVYRTSQPAALQFAMLAPIAQEKVRINVARKFYQAERFSPAALIYGSIPAESPLATADFFKELGISLYRSGQYADSATALMTAVDRGNESPETISYLTWLEERFSQEDTTHE